MDLLPQVVLALAELWWAQSHGRRRSSAREPSGSQSVEELISFMDERLPKDVESFVCLVVHNIDGPALRDTESQQCLGRVAACSAVRLIASVDHVNAPLREYI